MVIQSVCYCFKIPKFSSLNIYYQNVRGLRTKTHETYCSTLLCNLDLIFFCETWLNDSIQSCELFNNKYKVYRRDRKSSKFRTKSDGGGVLVAVDKKIVTRRMIEWESEYEDLWLIVDVPINNTIRQIAFCAVYLPPPVDKRMLDSFLSNCNRVSELHNISTCIIGDFNISCINWCNMTNLKNNCQNSIAQMLLDFIRVNNLSQCNVVNKTCKVLDLVLTDLPSIRVTKAIDHLCKIDPLHPPLSFSISTIIENKLKPKTSNCRFRAT